MGRSGDGLARRRVPRALSAGFSDRAASIQVAERLGTLPLCFPVAAIPSEYRAPGDFAYVSIFRRMACPFQLARTGERVTTDKSAR